MLAKALLLLVLISDAAFGRSRVQKLDMRDSTVAQIMSRVREKGNGSMGDPFVRDIMRQNGKSQSRQKLAELADSMVQRALHAKTLTDRAQTLSALVAAGDIRGPGTPYDGILDRLIRINRESVEPMRHSVYNFMLQVPGKERALTYLREAAMADDRGAISALGALMDYETSRYGAQTEAERNEVTAIIKELYVKNLAADICVRMQLQILANQRGWEMGSPSCGPIVRELTCN